jgi:hypothetical protein
MPRVVDLLIPGFSCCHHHHILASLLSSHSHVLVFDLIITFSHPCYHHVLVLLSSLYSHVVVIFLHVLDDESMVVHLFSYLQCYSTYLINLPGGVPVNGGYQTTYPSALP